MQLNNPKNNTSNLIKQSEIAKKKARRRLIGSIFMLFTALIILLNVTTKVKPIPVSPKVIEINSNASVPVKIRASAVSKEPASAPAIASSPVVASAAVANKQVESSSNGFRAGVVARNNLTEPTIQPGQDKPTEKPLSVTPKIVSQAIGGKPSPEDILNGAAPANKNVFFVQIAASQNKAALKTIQNNLAKNGIKSFIQDIKNNMYRLRVGPFKTEDEASQKLAEVQDNLNQ